MVTHHKPIVTCSFVSILPMPSLGYPSFPFAALPFLFGRCLVTRSGGIVGKQRPSGNDVTAEPVANRVGCMLHTAPPVIIEKVKLPGCP